MEGRCKIRHLAGTSTHTIAGGWIKFYTTHVTKKDIPPYCPCVGFSDGHKPHLLDWENGKNVVGAHCIVTIGRKTHIGVFPCCKQCNHTKNEFPPTFETTVVTVIDLGSQTFAGHLSLETISKSGKKSRTNVVKITSWGTKELAKDARTGRTELYTTVTGLSARGKEITQEGIEDKDTFLTTLITMTKQQLIRSSEKFKPELVLINAGVVPDVTDLDRKKPAAKKKSGKKKKVNKADIEGLANDMNDKLKVSRKPRRKK
jgi:hypothetical protein